MSALATAGAPAAMSSIEIASRTKKSHAHVTRDIRVMLIALYGQDELDRVVPEHYRNRHSEYIRENAGSIFDAIAGDEPKRDHHSSDPTFPGVRWERDSRGYISAFFLDKEHVLTLVSGYDVRLRKAIIDRWMELETSARPTLSLPDFGNPAIAARAWAEQYEARTAAERTKAEIGARREATAMNTASQAVKRADKLAIELDRARDYATVKRMQLLYHGQQFGWRMLKHVSGEMGLSPIDVFDANYGTVKAYHADVWREAYALEILAQADVEQGERVSL